MFWIGGGPFSWCDCFLFWRTSKLTWAFKFTILSTWCRQPNRPPSRRKWSVLHFWQLQQLVWDNKEKLQVSMRNIWSSRDDGVKTPTSVPNCWEKKQSLYLCPLLHFSVSETSLEPLDDYWVNASVTLFRSFFLSYLTRILFHNFSVFLTIRIS